MAPDTTALNRLSRKGGRPRRGWRSPWALAALAGGWLGCATIVAPRAARADEALAERRERIETLSTAEKEEVLEHQKQLAKMTWSEQERLRWLSRELEKDERAAELREVMRRYYDWLKTLPPYVQAELAEMPPQARVAKIKSLLESEEQGRKDAKGPGSRDLARMEAYRRALVKYGGYGVRMFDPDDVEGLLQWLDKYFAANGSQLLDEISLPHRLELQKQLQEVEKQPAGPKREVRRHEVLAMILLRWQLDNPKKMPPLKERDLKELRGKLSAKTRERLESRSEKEQWSAISGSIARFAMYQAEARRANAPLPISGEELAGFFEENLSPAQRDWLTKLPKEEIPRALAWMYVNWKTSASPGRPWERPGGEKRPGPPGPWSKGGPSRPPFPPPEKPRPPATKTDRAGT